MTVVGTFVGQQAQRDRIVTGPCTWTAWYTMLSCQLNSTHSVHRAQQKQHLHEADAALVCCRCEASHVPNDTAPERNEHLAWFVTPSNVSCASVE